MALSVTKASGSVSDHHDDDDLAVVVDEADDILQPCAGGCGKKILSFGFSGDSDWGEKMAGTLCIECLAKPLKHEPAGES